MNVRWDKIKPYRALLSIKKDSKARDPMIFPGYIQYKHFKVTVFFLSPVELDQKRMGDSLFLDQFNLFPLLRSSIWVCV